MRGNSFQRFKKSLLNADRALASVTGQLHMACANGVDMPAEAIATVEGNIGLVRELRGSMKALAVLADEEEAKANASEHSTDK